LVIEPNNFEFDSLFFLSVIISKLQIRKHEFGVWIILYVKLFPLFVVEFEGIVWFLLFFCALLWPYLALDLIVFNMVVVILKELFSMSGRKCEYGGSVDCTFQGVGNFLFFLEEIIVI